MREIGEHLGVARVGRSPRDVVAFAVASGGQGVDRVDLIVRRHQSGHDQAAVFLDAHDDVAVLLDAHDDVRDVVIVS